MLKFSSTNSSNGKYPKKTYDGQEDQSYGFNPSRKLQSGALRGEQRINGSVILKDGSFIVNDGSDDRFFAGKETDGSVKIKLSQDGYDVKDATSDQLIWSSDFNSFKIVASGTTDIIPGFDVTTPGAGTVNFTNQPTAVYHNLGFKPVVVAALYNVPYDSYNTIPFTQFNNIGSFYCLGTRSTYITDITDTYFTIETEVVADSRSDVAARTMSVVPYRVKYYLLRETAN